jgi:acetyl-CoA synthetase
LLSIPEVTLTKDERVFRPSAEFVEKANVKDLSLYQEAEQDLEGFWAKQAERLDWFQKWDKVLDWQPPYAKWFINGKLNVAYNCIDRHLKTARKNKAALIWEGEPGDSRIITYQQLYYEVNRFANGLKELGVKRGDRVTLYMPMIPELAIAMLACARIGAPHSVVFGGFSAEALRERINDCGAKIVVTADGGYRRGKPVPLKQNTDVALQDTPTVEKVIVVQRVGDDSLSPMQEGRDLWWHELVENQSIHCPSEEMDAEDILFILYTSGSTGKPKGVQHTTGGYITGVSTTHELVFDLKEDDIYFCTADIGWITGHSYQVYGPLANGATSVMYEGGPDYPARDRFWAIVEKFGVTIFYTAPTAIRSFMKWGDQWPARRDLSTLRLLGTVGEPINPEAWLWYHKNIGKENCPIVDTWWQTETGMILISPIPGVIPCKPGSATRPLPGIVADVLDNEGNPVPPNTQGYLVIKTPWPAMLRTLYGDDARYVDTYWSRYEGIYFTGDAATRDEDGYFWVIGRVDDVINVSGHRIGTAEIESCLVEHPAVAESAVIGKPHEVKGQTVVAFVTLREGFEGTEELVATLKAHVAQKIGALARPEDIIFTAELPKTRSGKIMRRLLRDIAEGKALGDTTTLADPSVVASLKDKYGDEG